MTIILLFNMLLGNNIIFSDYQPENKELSEAHSHKNKQESVFISEYQYLQGYEETIKYIKLKEGFEAKPYIDAAGIRTIGYGHIIMENESFPNAISEKQAEKILIKDFQKAIKAVERETELSGYKKLAISHFVYMMGIGNFNKSNLKKLISDRKPIEKDLLKWSYYRNRSGKMVKSNYSYKIRQWEADLYKR